MKKPTCLLSLALLFSFSLACAAALALPVEWVSIQHRQYDWGEQNRFSFGGDTGAYPLKLDTFGYSMPGGGALTVNGTQLSWKNLSTLTFQTSYGQWAGPNTWNYASSWETLNYYYTNVDSLPAGLYMVGVKDTNNSLWGDYFFFYGKKALPQLASSSVRYRFDTNGNMYVSWDIPAGTPQDASFVASLDGFSGNKFVSSLSVYNPYFVDEVCVPASVLHSLDGVDSFKLYVDLRIDGGQNRSITDTIRVTPTAPVPEPATMLMIGTGLLGLASSSRKRFGKP